MIKFFISLSKDISFITISNNLFAFDCSVINELSMIKYKDKGE